MLHRVFKTLTRLRPDAAIRAAYVLDLAGFGLVWWRLTDWPDPILVIDSGTVDTMAWAAIAASGLLLISAGIMATLARQAVAAQHYRIRVLATRHVQGLPLPVVPRRAWGRVRTSIDDAVARGAGPAGDVVRASDLVVGPGGEPSPAVAAVAARRTVVPSRPAAAATPTAPARTTPPTEPAAEPAGPEPEAPARPAAEPADVPVRPALARTGDGAPVRRPPGAAGRVAARRPRRPVDGDGGVPTRRRPAPVPGRGAPPGRAAAGARPGRPVPGRDRSAPAGRRTVAPGAAGRAVARRRAAQATGDMAARRAAASATAEARRQAREQRQASADRRTAAPRTGGGADTPPTGERRQFGERRQVPAPRTPVPVDVLDDEPPESATPVGVLRVLALAAHLALAGTFIWFVVEARRAGASSGDELDADTIERLDLVRTVNVVLLAVTVMLVGAWAAAAALRVSRGGRRLRPWMIAVPALPVALVVLAALLVDGRVDGGVLFPFAVLLGGLGGACSLVLLSVLVGDGEPGAHGVYLWAAALGVLGLGLAIGGYLQSIEPAQSLTTVTLVAVLSAILVGLGVLLGAPASGELDDLAPDAAGTGL
jgi:hypothetical protein